MPKRWSCYPIRSENSSAKRIELQASLLNRNPPAGQTTCWQGARDPPGAEPGATSEPQFRIAGIQPLEVISEFGVESHEIGLKCQTSSHVVPAQQKMTDTCK